MQAGVCSTDVMADIDASLHSSQRVLTPPACTPPVFSPLDCQGREGRGRKGKVSVRWCRLTLSGTHSRVWQDLCIGSAAGEQQGFWPMHSTRAGPKRRHLSTTSLRSNGTSAGSGA